MKKILFSGIVAAAILTACNSNEKSSTSETTVSSDTSSMSKMDTTPKVADTPAPPAFSDNDFATQAAEGGMTEVKAGELAVKMGTAASVKSLGKMMVTDHTKANNELKTIAAKNNITLPTAIPADKQQKLDALATLKGADFDKAFVDMMEEGHTNTIALFMTEGTKGTNADLKAFATKTLPTLNHHMEMVTSAKDAVNK
jgi:putative membrane protein